MKNKIIEQIEIPEGIECSYESKIFTCKKGGDETSRLVDIPGSVLEIKDGKVTITCNKANRKERAVLVTFIKHISNMFKGLEEKFVYELEICNVHFPMNVKIEKSEVVIDNFLGEKYKRRADIRQGVDVDVNGNVIKVSGINIESVGQTAANIEKATKVSNKDRRIFQDGIFITSKNGRKI
ncbi:50S ribosomal protein L6 [Candidatus Pacearchaeota archaeon CG10_big_fil_rev_8_21_14_0_10_34_76]|nr:MAG: 50S ribosomal protein L6 [Candidatus Pacearchaeota archaeon CG10_big_fil_rev_8_21_14_0_10_34_76]